MGDQQNKYRQYTSLRGIDIPLVAGIIVWSIVLLNVGLFFR